jgi:hypothetical protein
MSKAPAPIRHLILAAIAVLGSWAITDLVPWLNGQTGYGALAAALVAALVAYFTPLVNSYGVGKSRINYGVDSPHASDL